tara:strand:+ start:1678 stop:2064 length:387 start_codon:yes stop_codon:yes gene_type:complete
MALPKSMRLKGHRTFRYIHKNSKKIYGNLMDLRIAKSNPNILISHNINHGLSNFKLAITVSKKVSKKSVIRNRIRRLLQGTFLKNFNKSHNHIPYWVLVNLKGGNFCNYENELLKEFQFLIIKSGLFK